MPSQSVDETARIQALLGAAPCIPSVEAQTYLREWQSFSHPVALSCDDGNVYVVKGQHIGLPVVTEQVVARIGMAIGAPVGEPALVHVSAELIALEQRLAFLSPGVAHGNLYRPGWSDRAWIEYQHEIQNRERFALLAVLFGWAKAYDHQFIYPNVPPHLVLSVDHGHFLWGGTAWSTGTLNSAPAAVVDDSIVSACSLTGAELDVALGKLASATEQHIVSAVAAVPDAWGITPDERIALVTYFARRQRDLLPDAPSA